MDPDLPVADCDCPEYAGLSRRGLLRGALAVGAGMTVTAAFGTAVTETSYADTRSAPSVLVVLSMRGGVDGMSLVVPHGDPVYYRSRPRLAIPASSLLARNAFFGLHPELRPLLPLWNAGKMAAVHATGQQVRNRSHFAAIEEIEDAAPGSTTRTGWLNRVLAKDTWTNPLQGIQIGDPVPPTSLSGPERVIAMKEIRKMQLAGADKYDTKGFRTRSMQTMWAAAPGALGTGARSAMGAINDFARVRDGDPAPANGATYPATDFGRAMAAAARTIRGDVGAEVITVDFGSWDHHQNLGTVSGGRMSTMTGQFAQVLAAFFTDIGPFAGKVTVVTISEFGRRLTENSTYGLDHGHGNVMLLLGAGVRGGYHGRWPGLVDNGSGDDDLRVTTDYRSVLAEVVTRRMGASAATVFPGFTPSPVGAVL